MNIGPVANSPMNPAPSRKIAVPSLGTPRFVSPIAASVGPEHFVPSVIQWAGEVPPPDLLLFEKAGPRRELFFPPDRTRAAIVTCGGLCPGLNNVIRSITRELRFAYGVRSVLGVRGGYQGLDPHHPRPPLELTEEIVSDIHQKGGTLLGTSRGPVDIARAVQYLMDRQVDILFTVGGDGTQRGGKALFEEAARRGHPLAVVGIPKTIDNDVPHVSRSFGFGTAVDEAVRVIESAHTEASCVENGVSLVKVMGRHAGFIAAAATVANQDVNLCLIPEQPFSVSGLLSWLEKRLALKRHAVIVAAEGAGQDLLGATGERDVSGNLKLGEIGLFLRDAILSHAKARGIPLAMRYFDPGYQIRGCPANTDDSVLCDRFARHAVHAAMSGRTGMVISFLHGQFVHVPMELITAGVKRVDLEGELWHAVLSSTGQPAFF
jgi:6-phosphofructokinase 1